MNAPGVPREEKAMKEKTKNLCKKGRKRAGRDSTLMWTARGYPIKRADPVSRCHTANGFEKANAESVADVRARAPRSLFPEATTYHDL